jgi:hypothetical protein
VKVVDGERGDRDRRRARVRDLHQHHHRVAGIAVRRDEERLGVGAVVRVLGADHVRLVDVAGLARRHAFEPGLARADADAEVRVEDEVAADDAFAVGVVRVGVQVAIRMLEVLLDRVHARVEDLEAEAVAGDQIGERRHRVDGVRGARDRHDEGEGQTECDVAQHRAAPSHDPCPPNARDQRGNSTT